MKKKIILITIGFLLAGFSYVIFHGPQLTNTNIFLASLKTRWWDWWLWFMAWLTIFYLLHRYNHRLINPPFYQKHQLTLYGTWLIAFFSAILVIAFISPNTVHMTIPLYSCLLALLLMLLPVTTKIFSHHVPIPQTAIAMTISVISFIWGFSFSYHRFTQFGAGSKDLGLFHQSIWLLSQGLSPKNTIMGLHAFGDHMEFIDLLVAPLQWVWPNAGSLLLFQSVCFSIGAVGIFSLTHVLSKKNSVSLVITVLYLLSLDVQSGVMFDFNPSTCAMGLFPWVFYFFETKAYKRLFLMILLIMSCKENFVLYMLFFGFFTFLRKAPKRVWLSICIGSILVGVVEFTVLFPMFNPTGFRHFRYEQVAPDATSFLIACIKNPFHIISTLFIPSNKIKGLILPFSQTMYLSLLSPANVVTLLPHIAERFLSSHANRWWGHHYGGVGSVLAIISVAYSWVKIETHVIQKSSHAIYWKYMILLALLINSVLFVLANPWHQGDLMSYNKPYYLKDSEAQSIYKALQHIPDDASVAAQNHIVPHVSARQDIYLLKQYRLADYIILNTESGTWPYNKDFIIATIKKLERDSRYSRVFCEEHTIMFQRGALQKSSICPALHDL